MQEYLNQFDQWYHTLPIERANKGPAKGTIAAALVILEKLKDNYILEIDHYRADGGAQIKGLSGTAISKILKSHNENRVFLREGGRTNRGGPRGVDSLLKLLQSLNLENLSTDQRKVILRDFQSYLVKRIQDFFNQDKISIAYTPQESTWQFIHKLLKIASDAGKSGPVAQHLVGAKLELRFPGIIVENNSYSTADIQLNRDGDFFLGDTVFHVTVAPNLQLLTKCQTNLKKGLRVYLIVSHKRVEAYRQNIEVELSNGVGIESIESFVSQNIEEISGFSQTKISSGLRKLFEIYNRRIDEVELDKSLMIEIPANL